MIAVDSSSLIAYLSGDRGRDVDATAIALEQHQAILPPVVLTELLSEPRLPPPARDSLLRLPRLEVLDGYWERAGLLRARVLSRGWRARLADSLIAQSCIDHDTELISRDQDLRHFVAAGGLRLIAASARR